MRRIWYLSMARVSMSPWRSAEAEGEVFARDTPIIYCFVRTKNWRSVTHDARKHEGEKNEGICSGSLGQRGESKQAWGGNCRVVHIARCKLVL